MPEEQSVRAREGAVDPQGGGIPLRSGIPFLTTLLTLPQLLLLLQRPTLLNRVQDDGQRNSGKSLGKCHDDDAASGAEKRRLLRAAS